MTQSKQQKSQSQNQGKKVDTKARDVTVYVDDARLYTVAISALSSKGPVLTAFSVSARTEVEAELFASKEARASWDVRDGYHSHRAVVSPVIFHQKQYQKIKVEVR